MAAGGGYKPHVVTAVPALLGPEPVAGDAGDAEAPAATFSVRSLPHRGISWVNCLTSPVAAVPEILLGTRTVNC